MKRRQVWLAAIALFALVNVFHASGWYGAVAIAFCGVLFVGLGLGMFRGGLGRLEHKASADPVALRVM